MRPEASFSVRRAAPLLACLLLLGACASPPEEPEALFAPTDAQMKLRNMQMRTLDVADRTRTMRAVIYTLQDLGFIIERANGPLGVVSAAKFAEKDFYDVVGVTITVREVNDTQTVVRVNAIFNNQPVTDAETYRNFFATLERALFIGRN